MKLTTTQVSSARFHRRPGKGSSCYKKLLSSHTKSFNGSKREIVRETSPCDNSDDSGLGIENNTDYLYNATLPHASVFRFSNNQKRPLEEPYALNTKRHRTDLKIQNDLHDQYSFPVPSVTLSNSNSICINPSNIHSSIPMASKAIRRSIVSGKRVLGPVTLSSQLSSTSKSGRVQLQILNQPEQQHRARYQTEGSRGAVKDRTGNSFPVVKVVGYNRLTTLQVFIGSDQGRVTPHMFYQACRVTGKNSTPCSEKNINGTVVIEIDVVPAKDMTVTCDCVGILKERNVDVEHRFPEECSARSKKKSTRCRMVFRSVITNDDGTTETLQIASQPIACTQPPGVPEICKKSLTGCPVSGGKELFILGKNFLKDTHVVFQTDEWEQSVNPDKEFLQQTHLVCAVPAYKDVDIKESVNARISVVSGSRASEPHTFTYTPLNEIMSPVSTANPVFTDVTTLSTNTELSASSENGPGLNVSSENKINSSSSASLDNCESIRPVMMWTASSLGPSSANENHILTQNDSKMMPPPIMMPRRASIQMIVPDGMSSNIKDEVNNSVTSDVIMPMPMSNASNASNNNNSQLTNSFPPASFPSLPNVPILQEFAHNFHSISDVNSPLKSEPVPKVEPLSDSTALSSSDSYSVTQGAETQTTTSCIVSSIKNSSLCPNQSNELYMNSENFIYRSPADLYVNTVSKTEPRNSPVDELSTASSMIPSDRIPNLILSPSHTTLKQTADTSTFITTNSVSISQSPSIISGLRPIAHNKNYEFNKLLTQQQSQQQQQLPCSLKPSSNYKNIHNAFCYENMQTPATVPSVGGVYQNYINLDNESSLNNSDDVISLNSNNITYKKTSDTKSSITLNISPESSMALMENSPMTLVSPDLMRPAAKNTSDSFTSVLPLSKAYTPEESSYTQNAMLSEFVPSTLVSNTENAVPKLEELVNSAAESHIRSASSSSTSLNLLNDSPVSSTGDCATTSMALDTFLTETPQNNAILNTVVCNTGTPTNDSCVAENSLLVQSSKPATYQQCGSIVSNFELNNSTSKQMNMMMVMKDINVKEGKSISMVSGMSKKTEEGMFTSEISGMSDNDLLSYINPSCFDEV